MEGISGRAGIDGSVGITSSRLTPAHQERHRGLLLKTAGCTTFSLTKRAFDGCLAFREKLSSKAESSSMAGYHMDMKPWRIILKLCLGFLTSLTNAFCHLFPWTDALWFSESVFNQELEHLRCFDKTPLINLLNFSCLKLCIELLRRLVDILAN